jgi:hypothetical protein
VVAPGPSRDELQKVLGRLARAGEGLAKLSTDEVVEVLGRVGARLLAPGDDLRERVLAELPATAGVSSAQAGHVVEGMARDWTAGGLRRLLDAEFADPGVLEEFRPSPGRGGPGLRLRARPLGPAGRIGVHVCAGTVPGVSLTSLLRALLVRAPVLVKPGAGDVVLPLRFTQALGRVPGEAARRLADALAVVWWPGGAGSTLENEILAAAGHVVVYGSDETVRALGARVPVHVPVVAYPHRVGVAVVGEADVVASGRALARAVAAYDQRGCVSPQHAFVVGAPAAAVAVAEATAAGLDALDRTLPPGPPVPEEAAAVQQVRGVAEMRAAGGEDVHLLRGPGTRWTVLVEPEPRFRPSCLARTIRITPVRGVEALQAALAPVAPHLQTVGTGGLGPDDEARIAELVARLGASRVAPLDDVAFPGAGWQHDGQGPLRRLVRWCGWEPPSERGG